MRRLFLLPVMITCCATPSFAQGGDDYHKVEVFGGYSHNRAQTKLGDADTGFFGDFTDGRAGFDGFDIRAGRRVDVRAFQVDDNPTRLFGATQHNVRFGVGVVIH